MRRPRKAAGRGVDRQTLNAYAMRRPVSAASDAIEAMQAQISALNARHFIRLIDEAEPDTSDWEENDLWLDTSVDTLRRWTGTDWAPLIFVYVEATGGTVVDLDGYRIHTFNSNGSFVCTVGGEIEVLRVGGGGGGSSGGGGGGGVPPVETLTIAPGTYSIVRGAGGTAGTTSPFAHGTAGGDTTAFGGTAHGGGYGGAPDGNGGDGASGGGAGASSGDATTPGAGIVGEGNTGGTRGGFFSSPYTAGGGSGADAAADPAPNASTGGPGGAGRVSDISGSTVPYGGGGGGVPYSGGTPGLGGVGGGGNGNASGAGEDGDPNTGGGGGGAANPNPGGAGGAGVVIVRYPLPP